MAVQWTVPVWPSRCCGADWDQPQQAFGVWCPEASERPKSQMGTEWEEVSAEAWTHNDMWQSAILPRLTRLCRASLYAKSELMYLVLTQPSNITRNNPYLDSLGLCHTIKQGVCLVRACQSLAHNIWPHDPGKVPNSLKFNSHSTLAKHKTYFSNTAERLYSTQTRESWTRHLQNNMKVTVKNVCAAVFECHYFLQSVTLI